jgi:hypothetical protein
LTLSRSLRSVKVLWLPTNSLLNDLTEGLSINSGRISLFHRHLDLWF